jgi:hypothetical protein
VDPSQPPAFGQIADAATKRAFLGGRPEVGLWLTPGTKLFKWTKSIVTPQGISPWWQFLEARRLATGANVPGIREMQTYADRLGVQDRDYSRARLAVTKQWNKMTNAVGIELLGGKWGYVGKAWGQLKDKTDSGVYLIGGDYQVWIPGMVINDFKPLSILPYLTPNSSFGARSGD